MKIEPLKEKKLRASPAVAPDKSITHRAIMFNSAADASSFPKTGCVIKNALLGEDCLATIECMRTLGAEISVDNDAVIIHKPVDSQAVKGKSFKLDVGNSGTTLRLLCGLLAGMGVYAELTGDASIQKRPMERVAAPLREMGADIRTADGRAPVFISPSRLSGKDITMRTPSAQVKSAVILAALNAEGVTAVRETAVTRDHTEAMLKSMGADLTVSADGRETVITVKPSRLSAVDTEVGGDISAAAYWLVSGAVIPGAELTLKRVNINPTRTGILTIMKQAGCRISLSNITEAGGEPVADLTVKYTADLKPFEISGAIVPLLIDEIPALSVFACFIKGRSVIKNAAELKVKESDRIEAMVRGLKAMGAEAAAAADGMVIDGKGFLRGSESVIQTYGDHRIAMSMAVAALASEKGAGIEGMECCAVSFPGFLTEIQKMGKTSFARYALIGKDISYSASERVHRAIFEKITANAAYEIIDADEAFIGELYQNMKCYAGFNVTKPYKTAVIPHMDCLDASADICGAVNTVVVTDGKMTGYNTDGPGFIKALKYHKVDLKGKDVLVLGAGGAARAVIAALKKARCGIKTLSVYNRTAENALILKKELRYHRLHILTGLPVEYKTDVVINCTTAGQHGDDCPLPDGFDYGQLSVCIDLIYTRSKNACLQGQFCDAANGYKTSPLAAENSAAGTGSGLAPGFNTRYKPKETVFLKRAADAGVKTVNGAAMLVFQAVAAEKLWRGNFKLTKKNIADIIETI